MNPTSLTVALEVGNLSEALQSFAQTTKGYDLYVQDQLIKGDKEQKALGKQLKAQGELQGALEDLPFDKAPKRVFAVFTPEEAFTNSGIPYTTDALLFYWRDGKTWYLRDVTHPTKIFKDQWAPRSTSTRSPG